MEDITLLLRRVNEGDADARQELVGIVYAELKRQAIILMARERQDHTLQPTALVHEAWIKLVGGARGIQWENRGQFFAVAAQMMRRILVDYARQKKAEKRGGPRQKIELDDVLAFTQDKSGLVLALDEALERLEELDPRQCRVVEMRFFGGLSIEETAEVLQVSTRTVKRDWNTARAWLHGKIH